MHTELTLDLSLPWHREWYASTVLFHVQEATTVVQTGQNTESYIYPTKETKIFVIFANFLC
jgi:hypothetical protein